MRFITLLLIVFSSFNLYAKATVCLNMIVKDESAEIREALDSVKKIIDYWVIVDTGSTDGTQKIIKEEMKDIPGELHERPWKNFAHNRNEALQLAKNKGDYLLWMDGDDWLEFDEDFTLPELIQDAYLMKIECAGSTYYRYHLLKNTLPWRWAGVVHEVVVCDQPFSSENLEGIRYCFTRVGTRGSPAEYYLKHAEILEEALKEEPDNQRYVFYLAQSYRDGEKPTKAIEWYQKRVEMGGWEEEVFFSLLQIGMLQKSLGVDSETVIESMYRAHRYRPHRHEPIYYLAEIYNQQERFDLAYECIKGAQFLPPPPTKDILFIGSWVEEWGMLFQLSLCSYYLGHYQESLCACDKLLEIENLPESFRTQTINNRQFPLQKLAENSTISPVVLEEKAPESKVPDNLSDQITEMIKATIEGLMPLKPQESAS